MLLRKLIHPMKKSYIIIALAAICASWAAAQNNIAEEVAWVIGDDPIYKSEIEQPFRSEEHNV